MKWLALLAVAAALGLGCPRPIPPPVGSNPPSGGHYPACTQKLDLRPTDNCENFFTDAGLQCVACPQAEYCEAVEYSVYCAALKGCAYDPNCKYIKSQIANRTGW